MKQEQHQPMRQIQPNTAEINPLLALYNTTTALPNWKTMHTI